MEKRLAIDCGGVLDISVAAQWWEQAQSALPSASALRLDANELQSIDTAGLQALLVLCQAARSRQIPVQWEGVPSVLQRAAMLTGLSELLQLD